MGDESDFLGCEKDKNSKVHIDTDNMVDSG